MRTVGADLQVTAEADCVVELQIAVARTPGLDVHEELTVVSNTGGPVAAIEIAQPHHGRIHQLALPAGTSRIAYTATVEGEAHHPGTDLADLSLYRRPSRYVTSDTFGDFAVWQFGAVSDGDLIDAVSSWVGTQLSYVPGSSGPTDGAADTLAKRQGVCRDYAHLVIALLRSLGVPARLTAVYAPGCDPMDFHAVVEAFVAEAWHVVDATALAPRSALVRIATGRDAADTAFMTTVKGIAMLDFSAVTAVANAGLPGDDLNHLVQIH